MKILITGGCGFVGSNLAVKLKHKNRSYELICFDNLKRRGSELNIPRLLEQGISFIHGDIRIKDDLRTINDVDLIIDAAAEPSALAGNDGVNEYVYDTNLTGTFNLLNYAVKSKSKLIFLSTSRIYPVENIRKAKTEETESRFIFTHDQTQEGISKDGISERLPLYGYRTLYGTTKLSSEFLIKEFQETYRLANVINRCGVLAGPHQMGRIDQGFVVLWMARHFWKKELSYIGFNGTGKQVRDLLHIDDLFDLIDFQIKSFDKVDGKVYNVGGGNAVSTSLQEFTKLCEEITGNKININKVAENRPGDIPIYISDHSRVTGELSWKPEKSVSDIAGDIYQWLLHDEKKLKRILS